MDCSLPGCSIHGIFQARVLEWGAIAFFGIRVIRPTKWWLPWWLSGKESACQYRRHRFHPWVRKILWRREWQPTPVFLLRESHGQRSLPGYSQRVTKSQTPSDLAHPQGNLDIKLKNLALFYEWEDASLWAFWVY